MSQVNALTKYLKWICNKDRKVHYRPWVEGSSPPLGRWWRLNSRSAFSFASLGPRVLQKRDGQIIPEIKGQIKGQINGLIPEIFDSYQNLDSRGFCPLEKWKSIRPGTDTDKKSISTYPADKKLRELKGSSK